MNPARVIAAACAALFCAFAQAPASAADSGTLERALDRAFERYADLEEGEVADYIPALAEVDQIAADDALYGSFLSGEQGLDVWHPATVRELAGERIDIVIAERPRPASRDRDARSRRRRS